MSYIPDNPGFVSTDNSTVATLGIDEVFTGPAEDVSRFASVSVSWNADEASAKDGCLMQFSPDGTNWDRGVPVTSGSNLLQTDHGGVHRLSIIVQYFRVVYTNGGVAQTEFRLQTLFHTHNSMPLVSRLEQQLSLSTDCALVRPVSNIELDYARRQITGQRTFFLFGFNDGIGTAWVDVNPENINHPWPTSAAKVGVASSHAADTNTAGAGTRQVEMHGLSTTGVNQDEIIDMNGTTEVDSTLDYVRVNKLHNEMVGTYGGSHQGDVTARVTSGGAKTGNILARMIGREGAVDTSVQYGLGEAGAGRWSVPLGKVAYLIGGWVEINTTGTKTGDVILYEREGILNTSAPFDPRRVLWSVIEAQGRHEIKFDSFLKIKELTDIWFRAKGSGADTKINVYLEFYLVDANAAGE